MSSEIINTVENLFRKIYYFKYFMKFSRYGKNILLSKSGRILNPNNIILGNNIYIGRGFKINAKKGIVLGNNIMIGPNLVIESDNHTYNRIGTPMFQYCDEKIGNKIIIEDDVWIGANVVILPNVIIGEGSIVGAGSIVNKNIPPYCIAVGNPCRPVKSRFSNEDLKIHLQIIKSKYSYNEAIKNHNFK